MSRRVKRGGVFTNGKKNVKTQEYTWGLWLTGYGISDDASFGAQLTRNNLATKVPRGFCREKQGFPVGLLPQT